MSSSVCPLCRVSNTEDHQASGFHQFNQNLFKEGKMPISEQLYTNFEKARQEGQNNITNQDNTHVGHNVKGWHWQTIPMTPWFKATLANKIQEQLNFPHPQNPTSLIRIRLTEMDGEASIHNRKGKVFGAVLSNFKIEARCRITDTSVVTAKALIPDLSSDDFDDATITAISFEKDAPEYHTEMSKVIKNNAKKAFVKAVMETYKEMQHWIKNPSADIPQIQQLVANWDPPSFTSETAVENVPFPDAVENSLVQEVDKAEESQ